MNQKQQRVKLIFSATTHCIAFVLELLAHLSDLKTWSITIILQWFSTKYRPLIVWLVYVHYPHNHSLYCSHVGTANSPQRVSQLTGINVLLCSNDFLFSETKSSVWNIASPDACFMCQVKTLRVTMCGHRKTFDSSTTRTMKSSDHHFLCNYHRHSQCHSASPPHCYNKMQV